MQPTSNISGSATYCNEPSTVDHTASLFLGASAAPNIGIPIVAGSEKLASIPGFKEIAAMLDESTGNVDLTEIENIGVAANLLLRMFVELERLEANDARLHLAMSHSAYAIRLQLDMLSGITALLGATQTPLHARELTQQAKALILQLAGDLEQMPEIAHATAAQSHSLHNCAGVGPPARPIH
jgi:hypothetical protein